MIFLFDRIENTEGKGENAGYQHFLLFLQCFPKPSSSGLLKSGLCGNKLRQSSYTKFKTYSEYIPLIHYQTTILDWSKLKQIADDILNCI